MRLSVTRAALVLATLVVPGGAAAAPPRGPAVAPVKGGSAKLVPRRKQRGLATRGGPLTAVVLERVAVTGGLDEEAVRPVLRGRRIELERCLERHPPGRDRLQLELRVAASGRAEVVVRGASPADKALASCVRRAVAAAVFPARPLPTQVVVTLVFQPGAAKQDGAAKPAAGIGGLLGGPAPAAAVAKGAAAGVRQLEVRAVASGGLGAIGRGLDQQPPLAESEVNAAIASQSATLRRCPTPAAAGGTVRLELRIGAPGSVEAARILSGAPADPALQRCVVAAARSWRFPRPRGGDAVIAFTLSLADAR